MYTKTGTLGGGGGREVEQTGRGLENSSKLNKQGELNKQGVRKFLKI